MINPGNAHMCREFTFQFFGFLPTANEFAELFKFVDNLTVFDAQIFAFQI